MALRDWTLTLSGAAQQLSSLLTVPQRGGVNDEALRTILLQADGANANAIFVGSSSAVSSTAYGVQIVIPTSNVPAAPIEMSWSHSGPVKLSDFWVIGTAGQKLHILAVPF